MLVAPPRDGLAGHDVLDELLARQPRAGERVRLLRAQPGRDGLPLVGLAGAGGDLGERGAVSLNVFPSLYGESRCAKSMAVENGSGALVCGDGVNHQLLRDGAHELLWRRQWLGRGGRPLLRLPRTTLSF